MKFLEKAIQSWEENNFHEALILFERDKET